MKRLLLLALLLTASCTKTYVVPDTGAPGAGPSPVPVAGHTIEFRCVGDSNLATIDYATTEQGNTHVVASLPFSASAKTSRTSTFLSLRAAATGFGYLDCKILVDGVVFLDANQTLIDPVVEVSGTWSP